MEKDKSNNIFKVLAVSAGIIIISGAVVYGALAYSNHWWPLQVKETPIKMPAPVEAKKPSEKDMLSFKTPLRSKNPGDCTLEMTDASGKVVLKAKNSTKGQETQTKCEDWKVDRSSLKAGEYKAKITFSTQSEREEINTIFNL